jgi:hypothetical protein
MSSSSTPVPTPASEIVESLLLLVTGAVLAGPMLPGFLLTVPALILFAVVVLAPLVAVAVLATLAGAILASPYLLVRAIRGIRSRRAAARSGAKRMARPHAAAA